MIFSKNDRIGPYTVAFQHKQGSYAETYRVKDAAGKTRFLKLIDYSKLRPSQFDENGGITEVEVWNKRLHNPNLCAFVDSGNLVHSGRQYAYIVSEFVSGETLSSKIGREGDLSVYEIKTVAKAVLSALSCLHSAQPSPIIHNEITPQNVMLDLTGTLSSLKLIDFGHARFLSMPPVKPHLREMNVFYMAPERLTGVCSVQSDLFSVGAMIYRLLYGSLPWFVDLARLSDDEIVETMERERDKELFIPEVKKYELDDQLKNTVAKALSIDVDARFQTADEFISALDGKTVVERQSTRRKVVCGDKPATAKAATTPAKKAAGGGFAAVAGMDELKQRLREEVIEPLRNPEEYRRYGVSIPNGMLLYGPPGCGKTFFAKHFAEEVGFNFMCITPASLKSRYVNASQENIAKMFKDAEAQAPTIIFIDEINELVPNRQSDVHEMSRSAVNEMLAQMDRTGEKGVFVIGATNYPNMIDPAILRAGRIENKYYVGVPDTAARKALFKLYLSKRPYDFGLNYDRLAELTRNYVSADISKIVNDASRKALKMHSKITMQVLEEAIGQTQPSLSTAELAKYEKMRDEIEGKKPGADRPKIGFNQP